MLFAIGSTIDMASGIVSMDTRTMFPKYLALNGNFTFHYKEKLNYGHFK